MENNKCYYCGDYMRNSLNIIIKGRLDLMIKNKNDKIELWDFKARNVENIDDTFVKEQLKMYNIALQNQYNIDNLIAYTFKDNMKTPFDNSQKELDKTKKLLNNIKESIIKNKFEKNLNSKFCNYCDYRFLCYKNG